MTIPEFGTLVETKETKEFGQVANLESPDPEFGEVINLEAQEPEFGEVVLGESVQEQVEIPEQPKPEEQPKVESKESLFDAIGKGFSMQMKSGGFSGAPAATPTIAADVAIEFGTIAAIEAAFAYGAPQLAALPYGSKLATVFSKLAKPVAIGTAIPTTKSLIKKGELPSKEDLIEGGVTALAVDLIFRMAHIPIRKGMEFNTAVDNISKKTNVSKVDVLKTIWKGIKNWTKQKLGINNLTKADLNKPEVKKIIQDVVSKVEKDTLKITDKPIDITPTKPIPTPKPMPTPVEIKVESPVEKPITKAEADVRVDKTKPLIIEKQALPEEDTRGQGKKFHGSPTEIDKPTGEQYTTRNYYGQGFYTTDAKDISEGYSKRKIKGDSKPTIYEIKEKRPLKIYDMEKPISNDLKKQLLASDNNLLPEFISKNNKQTLRQLYDELRTADESADEIQENFEVVRQNLEREGYSGMKHVGGLRTNKKPHEVTIYFNPEKDLGISKFTKKPSIKTKTPTPKPLTKKPAPSKQTPKPLASKEKPSQPKVSTQPKKPKVGKKQAKKKSDIIEIFRKAFKDPIKQGKIRQNRGGKTLGVHKGWPKVSRLLNANDVETAAHEIGHNLHFTMYEGDAKTPQQQEANTIKALKPYLKELKPLSQYAPYELEGFAEFTRMYVTNPEAAKALAPEFYKKFETDLDKDFPEMKEALEDARDYYDTYLEGDARSVIRSHIAHPVPETFLPKFMEWLRSDGKVDPFKTNFVDDVFPAKRLVAEAFGITPLEVENLKHPLNLYKSLRLLKGAIGKADVFLLHETFDPNTLKKTGESFKSVLKGLSNKEVKDFRDYLVALRVVEKANQGIETGIPLAHAQELIALDNAKYKDRAIRFYSYMDQLLQYDVKSGVLSKEKYKLIKAKNYYYTPFLRDMGKKNKMVRSGSGLQSRQVIRQMKGSTRDLLDPFESAIAMTYKIILNGEKNRTGKVLAELSKRKNIGKYVERVPAPMVLKAKLSKQEVIDQITKSLEKNAEELSPEIIENFEAYAPEIAEFLPEAFLQFRPGTLSGKENIVTVFYDGKPQYYEVSPELYKMWKRSTSASTMNTVIKILSVPSRTLRLGAILNIKFIQKNLVRDWWERLVFTKEGPKITDPKAFIQDLFSPFAMLAQAYNHGPLYVEWLKSGAGMSTLQSVDRLGSQKKLKDLQKNALKKNPIALMRFLAEISEEGNRLAEFYAGRQNNPDNRFGMEQAAYASRDLSVDFQKMGALTQAFNSLTTFYNVGVQAIDKLIRMFASKEDRPRAFLKALTWLIIPSLLIAWYNKDDEDIKELQEQEKDFNFVFKLFGKIRRIPVPFEVGGIFHGLATRMFDFIYNKNPDAFDGFIKNMLENAKPNLTPTFLLPFIEAESNKNFFTDQRIIPYDKERLQSKYQYKEFTSYTARQIGRALDYIGGGDVTTKYASPAVIEHFINAWTGTWGRIALNASDDILNAFGFGDNTPKPNRPITERYGLDAFTRKFPTTQTKSIEKFYDQYQEMTTKELSIKHARKNRLETEEEIGKQMENLHKKYNVNQLKAGYDAIKNIQRVINNVYKDPEMPSEEKTILIDKMYRQMIAITKEVTKKH